MNYTWIYSDADIDMKKLYDLYQKTPFEDKILEKIKELISISLSSMIFF